MRSRSDEWTHRVSASELHRGVDILAGCVSLVVHPRRSVEIREQQKVRDESRAVAAGNGRLAESLGELLRRLDHLFVRGHGMDELHELHDLCRIEEVEPDHPLGSVGRDGHVDDRQRRSVRRKDGFRLKTSSSSANVCFLSSRCSGTASKTRSQSASPAESVVDEMRPEARRPHPLQLAALDRPADAALDALPPRSPRPRPLISAEDRTSKPLRATTSQMPEPIVPQPTTPTFLSRRSLKDSPKCV